MKPQDILILLKVFIKPPGSWTIARLAHELFMSKSEVHAAIRRLKTSKLLRDGNIMNCYVPNLGAAEEFLIHGLKYVFPGIIGKELRGTPTAHSALPLSEMVIADQNDIYVWPYEFGNTRGKSVLPLYKSVPKAVEMDREFYELLVLIDGIRVGRTREVVASENEIIKRLKEGNKKFAEV